jgi:hypothetical protein
MKKMNLKFLALLALVALSITVAGCSDDDDPIMTPEMGKGAMLRVVHASPNAPAVDVYAEGVAAPLLTNFKYTETSPYLDLAAGEYNIQLRGAGAPATSEPAFETGLLMIPDGAIITAVAAGSFGSTDPDDMFRVIPMVEDFKDPGAGNAAVRILHASPDAPAVSIDVGNDGNPEINGFDRFADTGADGVALPAGSALDVGIWAGSPLARVTAFQTPALPEADIILIATGFLGELPRDEMGFGILAIGPDGTVGFIKQNPTVFVLHSSPDAPAVDLFVGGTMTKLVDNLSFSELSPVVQVPPASYTVDVKVASSGALAATFGTPELMAGQRYLAIATGLVGGGQPGFTVLPLAEMFEDTASPLLRVVHASPDAPRVDVGLWDGKAFTPVSEFSDLGFGEASSDMGLALPAGNLTVGVAGAGSPNPVATFDIAPAMGMKAFAVAAGSLGGTGESFRLLAVETSVFPWQVAEVMPNP